jgi:regulator of protease activity HflC (stomatin/prohibitin superfamily)
LLPVSAAAAHRLLAPRSGSTLAIVAAGRLELIGLLLCSLKAADEREKPVVLGVGWLIGLCGPRLFIINMLVLDVIPMWIDHRLIVTPFGAEKSLTKDTVPVEVDAVFFWLVWDAQKSALEVRDLRNAIARAVPTALREVIGQKSLADILGSAAGP